jgi:hypothetical protein
MLAPTLLQRNGTVALLGLFWQVHLDRRRDLPNTPARPLGSSLLLLLTLPCQPSPKRGPGRLTHRPAGASRRVGLSPTGKRRLSTAPLEQTLEIRAVGYPILCGRVTPAGSSS